jgi:4-alpha-glucanotransferase
MHPTAGRCDGYAYLRRVLRGMLSVAGILRIDHVMGLHRVYAIPRGHHATDGAYIRYPVDELYAIVMIEAARAGENGAMIVGENLGTVPPAVNARLRRSGMLGMHVQQFALADRAAGAVAPPPPRSLVCLNTHDTPTFAAFWNADDLALRARLGLAERRETARQRRERSAQKRATRAWLTRRRYPAATTQAVFESLSRVHAAGPAAMQVVNLEDCWDEVRPQNIPGTTSEYPNWRRRSARPLERITRDGPLAEFLGDLARLRSRRRPVPPAERRRS